MMWVKKIGAFQFNFFHTWPHGIKNVSPTNYNSRRHIYSSDIWVLNPPAQTELDGTVPCNEDNYYQLIKKSNSLWMAFQSGHCNLVTNFAGTWFGNQRVTLQGFIGTILFKHFLTIVHFLKQWFNDITIVIDNLIVF